MDYSLDAHLGNIIWYNITDHNIHQYIDKNENDEGHFLQAVALVTNYSVNEINIEFAKELLHNYGYPSDDIYNIYIKCEDLFGILLQIPGRGNIARLYTYGEQIIKYLKGNILLLNRIIKKTEVEDEDVSNFIKKPKRKNVNHMNIFDKSLMLSQIVNEFETNISNSSHTFTNTLRDFFYSNCQSFLSTSDEFTVNHVNISVVDRKKRIMQDKDSYENKRYKSNEIQWQQIIKEMGYPYDKSDPKLRKCGIFGKKYKLNQGYDTSDNKFYYDRDVENMRKIVEYVYNGGDTPYLS
tara:strand:- start:1 stop:885 length:885 start_codon:yes stop_codon:yes gene_type:complete